MGAVFAIAFLLGLCNVGIALMVFGIIGVKIFPKKQRLGRSFGRPMTVVSIIALVIGAIVTVVPVGFFLFILFTNLFPEVFVGSILIGSL